MAVLSFQGIQMLKTRVFFFNHVILVIFVELRETSLSILDLTADSVSMESEIMRVISLGTMEMSNIP